MEPLTIELEVTEERLNELTWEQWEIFDAGAGIKYSQARDVIAMFVKGMSPEEAKTALGKLKTADMVRILEGFVKALKNAKEVNPPSGG